MQHFKKLIVFMVFGIAGLAVSGMVVESLLKGQGGSQSLVQSIEALKLRSAYPGMPAAEVTKRTAGAQDGVQGLVDSLSNMKPKAEAVQDINPADDPNLAPSAHNVAPVKDTYVQVHNQAEVLTNSNVANVKTREIADDAKMVHVTGTKDGREVVAVIENTGQYSVNHDDADPQIERIKNLAVPEEVKAKILANYRETGVLPEILVKEKRQPALAPGPAPSSLPDDPYNKKNW